MCRQAANRQEQRHDRQVYRGRNQRRDPHRRLFTTERDHDSATIRKALLLQQPVNCLAELAPVRQHTTLGARRIAEIVSTGRDNRPLNLPNVLKQVDQVLISQFAKLLISMSKVGYNINISRVSVIKFILKNYWHQSPVNAVQIHRPLNISAKFFNARPELTFHTLIRLYIAPDNKGWIDKPAQLIAPHRNSIPSHHAVHGKRLDHNLAINHENIPANPGLPQRKPGFNDFIVRI